MISRGLIVSLGTTSLISVLLFLYFRNRMTSVERKVSMLFKLIEEHHQEQQVQFMQRMRPPPPQNNLINVSDGESESDGSDTEYETESESDKLSIQDEEIKTIELTENMEQRPFQENVKHNLNEIPPLEKVSIEKVEPSKEIKMDVQQNLSDLKIKELKKLCGERGLTKYSHLNKAALVNLLEQS